VGGTWARTFHTSGAAKLTLSEIQIPFIFVSHCMLNPKTPEIS
jgi:hypothetical protein